MTQRDIRHFIIIDDDAISNHICKKGIEIRFRNAANIKIFSSSKEGLKYLLIADGSKEVYKTTLFLDINMPELSGWEILDKIPSLPAKVKEYLDIYILSSSVDMGDKVKARNNALVSGFIEKPLTVLELIRIFPPDRIV